MDNRLFSIKLVVNKMRGEIWNRCDINSKEIFTSGQFEIFGEKLIQTRRKKDENWKDDKSSKGNQLEIHQEIFWENRTNFILTKLKGIVICKLIFANLNKFIFERSWKEIWRMESSGKPGMVHISEKTYSFLEEEYYVQRAEGLEGRYITNLSRCLFQKLLTH